MDSGTLNGQLKRSPPHIVFIVDLLQPAEQIQLLVARILLYFIKRFDRRATWGYRFFRSDRSSINMKAYPFHPINQESVSQFTSDLREATLYGNLAQESTGKPTFSNVKDTLIQSLAEFRWKANDLMAETPSRFEPLGGPLPDTIDIKNFTYLITPIPHTFEELHVYTGRPSKDRNINTVADLQFIRDNLYKWLWDDFMESRISLSIIDSTPCDEIMEEYSYIYECLHSILKPIGGAYIHLPFFQQDLAAYGTSFLAIFDSFVTRKVGTKRPVQTTLEVPKEPALEWQGQLVIATGNAPLNILVQVHAKEKEKDGQNDIPAPVKDLEEIRVTQYIRRDQIKMRWLNDHGVTFEDTVFSIKTDDCNLKAVTKTLGKRLLVGCAELKYTDDRIQNAILYPLAGNNAVLQIIHLEPDENYEMPPVQEPQRELPRPVILLESAVHGKKRNLDALTRARDTPSKRVRYKEDPESIKKVLMRRRSRAMQHVLQLESQSQASTQPIEIPEIVEPAFRLPVSLEALYDAMQTLYYESLYTQKHLLSDTVNHMRNFVEHVLDPENKIADVPDVIAMLKSMTLLSSEHGTKHDETISEAWRTGALTETTLKDVEKPYFGQWLDTWKYQWSSKASQIIRDYDTRALRCLQIREAKLQLILYLFLVHFERQQGNLPESQSIKEPEGEVDRSSTNPEMQISCYYNLMVIWDSIYSPEDFLRDLDTLELNRKDLLLDPCDLTIVKFLEILEESLPNMADDWIHFMYEKCKDDWEDLLEPDLPTPTSTTAPKPKSKSTRTRSDQSSKVAPKPSSLKSKRSTLLDTNKGKTRAPIRSELPKHLLKREIQLQTKPKTKQIGEAAAAAIAKCQRSIIDGKCTMKRVGAFLKSANSPHRPRYDPSSQDDSKTYTLRMSPTTPRTRFRRTFSNIYQSFGFDEFEEPFRESQSEPASDPEPMTEGCFTIDDLFDTEKELPPLATPIKESFE